MRLTVLAAIFGLTINLEARDGLNSAMRQTAAEKPNDVELQTAIAQALQISPLTANSLIVVHVNQGEVTLEGAAVSPLARREATRLAETVLGVTAFATGSAS